MQPIPPHHSFNDHTLSRHNRGVIWHNSKSWLAEKGYMLRFRWQTDQYSDHVHFPREYETSWPLVDADCIYAVRVADGEMVWLKSFFRSADASEVNPLEYSSSKSKLKNHNIPILEELSDPHDSEHLILVLPLLREFDDPKFETVGEAVGCLRQVLEGVQSMHLGQGIHRNLSSLKVMMDPRPLYPKMYHPVCKDMNLHLTGLAPHSNRTKHPVKYYLRFGHSSALHPPPPPSTHMSGIDCFDLYPSGGRCDMHILGEFIRDNFLRNTDEMEFLASLVSSMLTAQASQRLTIGDAVDRFNRIVSSLSQWKLRSRLKDRDETYFEAFQRNLKHLVRVSCDVLAGRDAIPVEPVPLHSFEV